MGRFLLAALLLVATAAGAQWPGYTSKPGGSGSVTLTSGTTATSGCTAGGVLFSSSNLVACNDTDLTFNGTTLTATGLTVTNAPTFSALTATRIPFAGTAGLLGDSANLTYSNTPPLLTIGSGTTTSIGLQFGYANTTAWAALHLSSEAMDQGAGQYLIAGQRTGVGTYNTIVRSGGSGGSGITTIAGNQVVIADVSQTTKVLQVGTAGAGPAITAGTAASAVSALTGTQTWNFNTSQITAIDWTFTDTSSHAGTLAERIRGGASGTTLLRQLTKGGAQMLGSGLLAAWSSSTVLDTDISFSQSGVSTVSGGVYGWASSSTNGSGARDVTLSRIAANVLGVGTNAQGGVDGTVAATNYRVAAKPVILGTAPTIASGGCNSPTVTNTNGTAYFTIDVGTGCSGSQPVVFTLPAASTGWVCWARHVTTPASNIPRQTGAISTTSVTITNYAATTGIAQAWTDGDDVTIGCFGG